MGREILHSPQQEKTGWNEACDKYICLWVTGNCSAKWRDYVFAALHISQCLKALQALRAELGWDKWRVQVQTQGGLHSPEQPLDFKSWTVRTPFGLTLVPPWADPSEEEIPKLETHKDLRGNMQWHPDREAGFIYITSPSKPIRRTSWKCWVGKALSQHLLIFRQFPCNSHAYTWMIDRQTDRQTHCCCLVTELCPTLWQTHGL